MISFILTFVIVWWLAYRFSKWGGLTENNQVFLYFLLFWPSLFVSGCVWAVVG